MKRILAILVPVVALLASIGGHAQQANNPTFIQQGAGAVARSMNSKIREQSSATDYSTIQQALDYRVELTNGEVVVPPGTYSTNAGLRIVPLSGQVSVNVRGLSGALGSIISYTGAGGTALLVKNNTRYKISNLELINAGSGVDGLALQSLVAGSSHGPALFENIYSGSFTNNFHIGTTGDLAASELTFKQIESTYGVNGFLVEGINSVGMRLESYNASANTNAFNFSGDVTRADNIVSVRGASFSLNDVDFALNAAVHFTAEHIFSEATTGARAIDTANAGSSTLPMHATFVDYQYKNNAPAASRLRWPGTYLFDNCRIEGGIEVGNSTANGRYHLYFRGGSIPAVTYAAGAHSLVYVHIIAASDSPDNSGAAHIEEHYVFLNGGVKRTLYSYPWNGHPTAAIPTALPQYNSGLVIGGQLQQKRTTPTYGASVAIDASLGNFFDITATNGTAFTVANPTNALDGQQITLTIRNTSGGALGAITWDTLYKLSAWTSPATGFSRSITFKYSGTNLIEVTRTSADVPN